MNTNIETTSEGNTNDLTLINQEEEEVKRSANQKQYKVGDTHVSVHGTLKTLPCPHCEYYAAQKHHLDGHIRAIHQKSKDWSCPKCDYSASFKVNLQVHMKKFHGEDLHLLLKFSED